MTLPQAHPYDPDLLSGRVWATAVLRRMTDLASLMGGVSKAWRSPTLDESVVIIGDSNQAATALNAALEAAARYLKAHPDVEPPVAEPEFENLRVRARAARDAAAHWDDKMARASETRLEVNGLHGLKVVAPGKFGTTAVTTVISWTEMERAALACLRWSAAVRAESGELKTS